MSPDENSGDDGTTGLIGGRRVEKDSIRIETLGALDELNCTLGLAAAACEDEELSQALLLLQHHLFDLGADLATPEADGTGHARMGRRQIDEAEHIIEHVSALLAPMRSLVIPEGSELAARLHLARAVCRRAERLCVALGRVESVNGDAIVCLNRLGDLLFVLARRANQLAGVPDVQWPPATD